MRRGFSHLSPQSEESEIDITPMLDVVFIMLIFFIVTASFVKESGIEVEVWINKRKVELGQVRANIERLHAENPQGAVVVQADEEAKTRILVGVIDAARAAGVADVSLSTEKQ